MKRVSFVQTVPIFGEVERNLMRVERLLPRDSDLVVLPELFNTGYLLLNKEELLKLAEPIDGITGRFLAKFSKEHGTSIVAGLPEKSKNGIYNSAMVIDETGDLVGVYRKTHLFGREKLLFRPGDTGFRVFNLSGMRVGVLICFDWIFPEASRVLALDGAEVLAHPANLVLPYAQSAMLTRSIENRVFTVTANRSGEDDRCVEKLEFTGASQITSPDMRILVRAPERGEYVGTAEIDPRDARNKKITEQNDLWMDRRPEFYGRIMRR